MQSCFNFKLHLIIHFTNVLYFTDSHKNDNLLQLILSKMHFNFQKYFKIPSRPAEGFAHC